ncbi:hypothetical protein VTL71DRAFT_14443 [Oculimacula yallundae]|uniref:Zn(2)-C6 fungal-type domain-containing protein n=1 Tax=Oculimacula yallundae TaxID=86028 RepID=A0ABR4CJ11_9HELO
MRRGHHKTRSGCRQCKIRRVKCDEGKPVCSGCRRNQLECSYKFLTPTYPRPQFTSEAWREVGSSSPCADLVLTSDASTAELLQHYSIYTARAMSQNLSASKQEIWRIAIPHMALSHEWLMHGMLAVSALHLLSLQPSRKAELVKRASISESLALPLFRQTVSALNPQPIDAIFAFAGFAIPYVLALSTWLELPASKIPGYGGLHWFKMVRGLSDMLREHWLVLMLGPFAPLLDPSTSAIDSERNPDDIHLARLHKLLKQPRKGGVLEEKNSRICREALSELRRVSALHYAPIRGVPMISAVYIWPGSISGDFVELLFQKLPEALAVLAHYCVLLKFVDSCWYMKGVGEKLLAAINEELNEHWQSSIQWAMEQPCR